VHRPNSPKTKYMSVGLFTLNIIAERESKQKFATLDNARAFLVVLYRLEGKSRKLFYASSRVHNVATKSLVVEVSAKEHLERKARTCGAL